ncbi:MAG: prepilin peptidase [Patescibacteria group bacterium]
MMFLSCLVAVVGLALGSFLNVLVGRFEKKQTSLTGRSYCDSCSRQLLWWENIPLLSFLFLRGKCRTCHQSIPFRYFLVELTTGLMFLFLFWRYWLAGWPVFLYLAIAWCLLAIFLFDWDYQIIPDRLVVALLVLTVPLVFQSGLLLNNLLVGLIAFGFLLFLHLITKGKGMGLGDVKLAFFIGFFLGFPRTIWAFYIAFLTGAVLGVILILLKRKKFGQTIAFGPFLILGVFLAWLI